MAIQFIVIVAVFVGVFVAGLAFILRRLTEGGPRRGPKEPAEGARTEPSAENAWRDKFLFPMLVSIASGVVVAVVLYLLGIK
jgi:hypothetical protein